MTPGERIAGRKACRAAALLTSLFLFSCLTLRAAQTDSQQALYQQTMEQFEDSDFNGALRGFQTLLDQTGRPEFRYYLGYCRLKLGRYEEARRDFDILIQEGGASWEAELGLARALFQLDQLEQAGHYFGKVAESRNETDAYYHLGLISQRRDDCDAAVKSYRRVLLQEPYHRGALFNLGQCSLRLGDRRAAEGWLLRHREAAKKWDRLESVRKAANLPTATPANLLTLAQAQLDLQQWESALATCRSIRERAPALEVADYLEGYVFYRLGRLKESIERYRRFLASRPNHRQALFDLGHAYRKAGRSKEAMESFSRAAAADPENPLARLAMAEMDLEAGRLERALERSQGLTGRFPGFAAGHFIQASVLAQIGRWEEALAPALKAIELDETTKSHYRLAGTILKKLGRLVEAEQAFARARQP